MFSVWNTTEWMHIKIFGYSIGIIIFKDQLGKLRTRKIKLFIFTYSFSDALPFLLKIWVADLYVFLITEEPLLTLLAKQVDWQKNSLNFCCLRNSLSNLHFWGVVLQDTEFYVGRLCCCCFPSTLNISLLSLVSNSVLRSWI